MFRNLALLRSGVVMNSANGGQKYLSTRQHPRKRDSLFDQDNYPSENGIVRSSPFENITVPNLTIDQYVWNNFREWETKIATVCGVTDRKYTYAELRDHSAAFAVRLQMQFQMQQNDVLAVCLPNIPEFPIATLGAVEAGMVVTTVNPMYTPDEISRQLIDSNAKMIVTTCMQYKIIEAACLLAKKNIPILTIRTESDAEKMPEGAISFTDVMSPYGLEYKHLKHYETSNEDIAFLPYSSGTTGLSKGVQLRHRNIIANSEQLNVKMYIDGSRLIEPTTDTFQDVVPCVLPFFHIYGFNVTLMSKLALGCKIVTLPKFLPDTFLNAMEKYKGTMLHLVPPIILFLGHNDKVEKKHVEHIRTVMSGAAPMGASDAERFTARAPKVEFLQGYGLTETSPVVLMASKGCKNLASVGVPTPNTQAKIVSVDDPTNTGLGPNQVGELLVRGPQVMKGYHNRPDATDDMLIENDWLRTGDMFYYDESGSFYITDRLKELIKVKGFQVPPAELEEILRSHPNVLDAAVVGVPHPINGEAPRAFVVPKDKEITEQELKDFVAEKVAKYKRLEGGVTFLEAIPKNASGKILRREIKDKYC